MSFNIEKGWLTGVKRAISPNFNQRPPATPIDLLVIHNISLPPGQFGTGNIEQLFCNTLDHSQDPYFSSLKNLNVSAHLLIERNGDITQFVSFAERAWHAGVSCFRGKDNCNDYSIGVELEGTDETPYTESQYTALIQITKLLLREYPYLTADRIVGHSDIAPERKSDPGAAFDWSEYLKHF